jgi:hypothetical protein
MSPICHHDGRDGPAHPWDGPDGPVSGSAPETDVDLLLEQVNLFVVCVYHGRSASKRPHTESKRHDVVSNVEGDLTPRKWSTRCESPRPQNWGKEAPT